MNSTLLLLLLIWPGRRDQPCPPSWSPDHQVLATTKVERTFVTPEGAPYTMLLNGRPTYPVAKRHPAYTDIHTFLSDLAWSPGSEHVAFVEEIYSWEYRDPYNSDFEGEVTARHFYLAIVSRAGEAVGYGLKKMPTTLELRWDGPDTLVLNDERFDFRTRPPRAIP